MTRIVEYDGFEWFDDEENHARVIGNGHESGLIQYLPEGRVCIDVGAHIGHYTLPLTRRFQKVYAIEPDPEAARQLTINVALNRLDVTILRGCAWNEKTQLDLSLKPGQSRHGPLEHSSGSVLVDAWPLDAKIADRIDFVKMDIEGAEVEALQGMDRILSQHPKLLIEMHDEIYGQEIVERVAAILSWHGYGWTDIPWTEGYGARVAPHTPAPHWWSAQVA